MCRVIKNLKNAAEYAWKKDERSFYLAAIGIRSDGAIVRSRNGSNFIISPDLHAEARVAKKLDVGSTVFVSRVRRDNGQWANARPCRSCRAILKSRGVRYVYYTIAPGEYGKIDLNKLKTPKNPTGKRLNRLEPGRWNRGIS